MSQRGKKAFGRKYIKIIKRIIICIILIMLILMFWQYISDLNHHIDVLAKYNHEQSIEIGNLQHQINVQNSNIEDLKHQITYITNKDSIKVQFHHQSNDVKDTLQIGPTNYAPTVIVTVLTIVGGFVRHLVPSF